MNQKHFDSVSLAKAAGIGFSSSVLDNISVDFVHEDVAFDNAHDNKFLLNVLLVVFEAKDLGKIFSEDAPFDIVSAGHGDNIPFEIFHNLNLEQISRQCVYQYHLIPLLQNIYQRPQAISLISFPPITHNNSLP
ncbi:Hypothetical predicted protein [Octopus vulgaris]|uniref:Uncharacterized protein n=1 Tax=Octopus vulgaris TaxID=6645 RepID=A0AA36AIG2_OCTVU|nr:Hypothetical predicted protein [Octopus vulgaris]